MSERYIVSYWIESPSPYLVVDTQPETDGTSVVIGGFTASIAAEVAAAMNEKGELAKLRQEIEDERLERKAELDEADR